MKEELVQEHRAWPAATRLAGCGMRVPCMCVASAPTRAMLSLLPPPPPFLGARRLADVFAVIKDCSREMEELEAGDSGQSDDDSAEEGEGGEEGTANGGGAADDVDLDFEAGPLSEGERPVLAGCRELVAVAGASLRAASGALLAGGLGRSGGRAHSARAQLSCCSCTSRAELAR